MAESKGVRVGLVKIPVTDLGRAATFYREVLGLPEEFAVPAYGWAQYSTEGVPLCLYISGRGGGNGKPGSCDSVHLVVRDAKESRAGILQRGGQPTDVVQSDDGGAFFEVQDPDGNTIKFMQARV
ncbi:MAG: VOC family protein [Candidatus Brocadiae bacterium]|nr:VOC family protein [Candidatus Brocadiia bacterium]